MAEILGTAVGSLVWGFAFAKILMWLGIWRPVVVAILVALAVVALNRFGFGYLTPLHFIMTTLAALTGFLTAAAKVRRLSGD